MQLTEQVYPTRQFTIVLTEPEASALALDLSVSARHDVLEPATEELHRLLKDRLA